MSLEKSFSHDGKTCAAVLNVNADDDNSVVVTGIPRPAKESKKPAKSGGAKKNSKERWTGGIPGKLNYFQEFHCIDIDIKYDSGYSCIHLFPDCVMVAPQILVLIVGVRILLGENFRIIPEFDLDKLQLAADGQYGPFEYRFSSPPSQGEETGSTPVGTARKTRIFRVFFYAQSRWL